MDISNIIKAPHVTEKMTLQKGESSSYCFNVDRRATKVDIRSAVETIFNVKVDKVQTMNVHGKSKINPRTRRLSRASNWKKAVVTLKKGDKIELFEGV
ncbi:MAG: 50S ribosomal protein L23 [Deltaproteobacteria bacterium]|nr:50S ribosomal protein L23 [Deltaproteobacteria bacterium]MBI2342666.1 50S ribosomal protein L23 [Deltaproteobacteria bacterium]MBI2973973.1 50S ribosomal protein L23 [Deltaproteobacteria bacterium]